MDFREIKELIRMVNQTELSEVEIKNGDFKIRISRQSAAPNVVYAAAPQVQQLPSASPMNAAPVAPTPPQAELAKPEAPTSENANLYTFTSPMIGTFYRAPSPDAPPFVKVGDVITVKQKLGIIEAMKIMSDLESDVAGKVVKILVENARPVEYGQPLFLIEKA